MTLDPEVQLWLQQQGAAGQPAWDKITVEEARRQMDASTALLGPVQPVERVADMQASGPAGPIPVRLYDPTGTPGRPIIVFFHGGGWVVGGIATHDHYCRELANASQMMVVSVDYRLAPEHRYPAAAEDAYVATKWVAENAEQLGGDPQRIAVAGDSAGGNLAAVVALMARDRGGPKLSAQLLIYPITDHNFDTDSYLRNMSGYHLTRDAMIWFWDHYAPEPSQRDEPYASPLRATNLEGLPPAIVLTAEYDPLLDEGEAYARRLESAGVPVHLKRYAGSIHGFIRRTHLWAHARQSVADAAAALKTAMRD